MAAEYDLGTAHGQVVIDSDSRGVGRADNDLKGLQARGESVEGTFRKLSTGMLVAGAGIAAGIGLAVKSAVDFDKRLSGIKAVSGATTAEMEGVRAKALQLGKDTKFSAGEAAQAIEELAKAGVSLPDILNGAADATVALAAAGEIDLPQAAEIAANAMNTFRLKAADLPKVADLIAGAANASAISVGEFRQSLQQSGAAAALVGVSFDDLAVAIAEMGNAGIKGSDAGTSLKTFLTNLQPDTLKQTKLFKQLGLITADGSNKFFDAAGNIKSLSDVSQILQDSLKGMTNQQKQAALQTLFGSDAIRAAAIISSNGAKGFDKLAASMGKVKSADVAKTRMDNLAGSVEQLKGSLETAGIVIGTIVIPALRRIVDAVTGALNAFLELSPAAQSAVLNIAGAASAFLLVGGTILKLISILRVLRVTFATVWAASLGPIGLIIALIIAVGAAVFILYQRFQPVRNVVDAVGRALQSAFTAVLPIIKTVGAGVRAFMAAFREGDVTSSGFIGFMERLGVILKTIVIPAIIATGQWLVQTFGPVIRQVISIVSGFVTAIIGYFRSIQPQLSAIFNALVAVFRFTFGLLAPIVLPILRFIFNFVIQTIQLLVVGIRVLLAGLANIFRGIFNIIGGIIKIFLSLLTGQWGAAWDGVKQVVRGALQFILGIIQAVVGGVIIAVCVSSLKLIGNAFRASFAAIRGIVSGAMSLVRAVISGGMAAARAVVSTILSGIRAAFSGNLGALVGIARTAITRMVGAIRSAISAAPGVITSIGSRMVNAVTSLGSRMFSAGAEIISRLVSGITSKIEGAVNVVKGAVSRIAGLLPGSPVKDGPLRVLNNGYAGRKIAEMLTGGIRAGTPDVIAQAERLTAGVEASFAALARNRSVALSASAGVATAGVGASVRGVTPKPAQDGSGAFAGASTLPPGTPLFDYDLMADAMVRAQKRSGLADEIGRKVGTVITKGGRA